MATTRDKDKAAAEAAMVICFEQDRDRSWADAYVVGCVERDKQTIAFLRETAEFLRVGEGVHDRACALVVDTIVNRIKRGEHVT